MQPSDTAKDVPAKRNGSLGIKSRLSSDSDHAGSMKERQKRAGNISHNLFTSRRGKVCGTFNSFIGVCNAGIERTVRGAAMYKQLTKADTEQT